MGVDTSAVQQECEERRERERAVWRASCEVERDRAKGREEETTKYSSNYSEVVAISGRGRGGMGAAVGEGHPVTALQWRGESEVSVLSVVLVVNLKCLSPRALMTTFF